MRAALIFIMFFLPSATLYAQNYNDHYADLYDDYYEESDESVAALYQNTIVIGLSFVAIFAEKV